MKTINAKLGSMRKPQTFIVFNSNTDNNKIIIQSDKSIGMFDKNTGEGVLNIKGSYFLHLNPIMGAKKFIFEPEFLKNCLEILMNKNEEIIVGVYMA